MRVQYLFTYEDFFFCQICNNLLTSISFLIKTIDKKLYARHNTTLLNANVLESFGSWLFSINKQACCLFLLHNTANQRVIPVPQSEKVWKQARSALILAAKYSLCAKRIQHWADEDLYPTWAVGRGPIPDHLMGDSALPAILGEIFAKQGAETMRVIANSLLAQANRKEKRGEVLLKHVQNIYGNDFPGFHSAKVKLQSFVKKAMDVTIRKLNRQEDRLRQSNMIPDHVFRIRNPIRQQKLNSTN